MRPTHVRHRTLLPDGSRLGVGTRPGNETGNSPRILHECNLLDEAKQLGVLPESIVMKDAVDSSELTRLDLKDLKQ